MRRAVVLGVLVAAASAHADDDDLVGRPLVLAPGRFDAQLDVEIDLAPGVMFHPTSLAPDAWYGIAPRWQVGVVHSYQSVDRIEPGASFCVVKEDIGCNRLYHGSGVDALWSAVEGALAVAPRVRFLVRDLAPVKPAVTVGALVRWTRGRVAVWGDPYLRFGLANADESNRTALYLPITFAIQPTRRVAVELSSGWNSDLAIWRDGYYVPVAAGVRARATTNLDVAAQLGFRSLIGAQATPKDRVLFVTFGWRS